MGFEGLVIFFPCHEVCLHWWFRNHTLKNTVIRFVTFILDIDAFENLGKAVDQLSGKYLYTYTQFA